MVSFGVWAANTSLRPSTETTAPPSDAGTLAAVTLAKPVVLPVLTRSSVVSKACSIALAEPVAEISRRSPLTAPGVRPLLRSHAWTWSTVSAEGLNWDSNWDTVIVVPSATSCLAVVALRNPSATCTVIGVEPASGPRASIPELVGTAAVFVAAHEVAAASARATPVVPAATHAAAVTPARTAPARVLFISPPGTSLVATGSS